MTPTNHTNDPNPPPRDLAISCLPCRRTVVTWCCSPIIVEKASSDVTDGQAQALCDEVQAAVLKLYAAHKPSWETRPAHFER